MADDTALTAAEPAEEKKQSLHEDTEESFHVDYNGIEEEVYSKYTYVEREELCNRELSWLDFETRVVEEATLSEMPLLERLRFVSIYYSNLDEFFRVRVGSLMEKMRKSPKAKDKMTGWTPKEQVARIFAKVSEQEQLVSSIYYDICRELAGKGIEIINFTTISRQDEALVRKSFDTLRLQLSPQIISSTHPFPFLQNESQYVVAVFAAQKEKDGGKGIGLIPLGTLPPYMFIQDGEKLKVVITADLVEHFVGQIFKKQIIASSGIIRVTRNAEIPTSEAALEDDFRNGMQKLINLRKRLNPVRLQIKGAKAYGIAKAVCKGAGVSQDNIIYTTLPMNFSFVNGLMSNHKYDQLKYPPHKPARNIELTKGDLIGYLDSKDILISFPYQSMQTFIDLLYESADDPTVREIKITLYRLSSSSKIAAALAYASERGKDVTCLLELRARFDEQNNIDYSRMLENAGCTVIYGLPWYKVHSKLCLITRQVAGTTKYITQVGTGNYNEDTAELYTDLMLITSNTDIGVDAWNTFEALSTGEVSTGMHSLWVAPDSYMPKLFELIDEQIRLGHDGYVAVKCNSMNDVEVIDKFIEASRSGVRVELFIRGICCMIPGIPGITENITVKSVVGRYLEHSRIFVFGRGDDRKVYIGSGDLLERNTKNRVEAFVAVTDRQLQAHVLRIIDELRKDTAGGWNLRSDGEWRKVQGEARYSSQEALAEYFESKTCAIAKPEEPRKITGFASWIRNILGIQS